MLKAILYVILDGSVWFFPSANEKLYIGTLGSYNWHGDLVSHVRHWTPVL